MSELITRATAKMLDAAEVIQATPPEPIDTGYLCRSLVLATLPHSCPKTPTFQRRNGNYTLTVTGGPHGLPYGTIPRIVLCWLCTEIVRSQSRTINLGASLSQFMADLDLMPTGGRWGSITRLREQMRRLFTSMFTLTRESTGQDSGQNVIIADEYHLFWDKDAATQQSLWPSRVVVSERFYKEVMAAPVPFDLRALKMLRRSPLALDLYIWTAFRAAFATDRAGMSWQQLADQIGSQYTELADFRKAVISAMKKVGIANPQLRYGTTKDSFFLEKSTPPVPMRPKKRKPVEN